MNCKKIIISFAGFISLSIGLFAQNKITYNGSGNYTLVERTDLRRYDNNRYIGLVSREVRSYITPVSTNNGYLYEGNFFVNQDTMRNSSYAASGIHDSILSVFKISSDGILTMVEDHGYPSFRSFPSYPKQQIQKGDRWQAKAERAVDPLNKGIVTKMPIYVEYTYNSDENLNGEPVYLITAQWATRYGMGSGTSYIDWGGDKDLQKATGSHKATILVSKKSGNALVIRDTVDEVFVYSDGNQIAFKGQINLFTEYPPAVDRDRLLPALRKFAMIDSEMEQTLKEGKKDSLAMASENNSNVNNGYEKNENNNSISAQSISGNRINQKSQLNNNAGYSEKYGNTALSDSASYKKSNMNAKNSEAEKSQWEEYKDDSIFNGIDSNKASSKITDSKKNTNTQNTKLDSLSQGIGVGSLKQEAKQTVSVDQTAAGIRLTIQDLQFAPDSALLLPGEAKRLDNIAAVLKEAGQSQFLIEGHTASTGREAGEMQLSLERAHAIADELTKRGIQASRFICKGSGGKKPVADNKTSDGKARNRRVEITILE